MKLHQNSLPIRFFTRRRDLHRQVVEGAVAITRDAVAQVDGVVEFSGTLKSRLVTNLFTALVSKESVKPVLTLGTKQAKQ